VSEVAARLHAVEGKKPIEILRDRRGGVPPELIERNRQQAANRRRIVDALKMASKTVPEIAKETGLLPHEVFWHLMAMKKYGKLVEGQQREDYFEYALAEASEQRETAS
jgi:predicted Rossmann fold nucleotide-binding protein DprA/Smf involved in DNA uptake